MIYEFKGLWNCESRCDIEIHNNLVVATEIADNPGTSITNFAEHLATNICIDYTIPFDKLIWIEHYPERSGIPESYSKVTFTLTRTGFVSPNWKHISKENFLNLLYEAHK